MIFSVESEGQRESVQELLARIKIKPAEIPQPDGCNCAGIYITDQCRGHSFGDNDRQRVLICESDMLGERVVRRPPGHPPRLNTDTLIRNLAELRRSAGRCIYGHRVGRYRD